MTTASAAEKIVLLLVSAVLHSHAFAESHSPNTLGAGLILSTPRMLESVNSGAQRGAGGHVGLIGATLPT